MQAGLARRRLSFRETFTSPVILLSPKKIVYLFSQVAPADRVWAESHFDLSAPESEIVFAKLWNLPVEAVGVYINPGIGSAS